MRDVTMTTCFGTRSRDADSLGRDSDVINCNDDVIDRNRIDVMDEPDEVVYPYSPCSEKKFCADDSVVLRRKNKNAFRNLKDTLSLHLPNPNGVLDGASYINALLGEEPGPKVTASAPVTPHAPLDVTSKLREFGRRVRSPERETTSKSAPSTPSEPPSDLGTPIDVKMKFKEFRRRLTSPRKGVTSPSEVRTKWRNFRRRVRSEEESPSREKEPVRDLRRSISESIPVHHEETVCTLPTSPSAPNGCHDDEVQLRKKGPRSRPKSMMASLRRSITISFHGERNISTVPEDFHRSVLSFSTRNKASEATWHGTTPQDVPLRELEPLSEEIFTSYTGPEDGLVHIHNLVGTGGKTVLGAEDWRTKTRKAYGISASLYDQHPVNGKISGDPIADSFAVCARTNNALLVIADGVNWGEKSKMAARCAVYGCVKYINDKMFGAGSAVKNTQEAMQLLLDAFWEAHRTILHLEGGLTTLCAALVLPLRDQRQFAVCTVNVGDSLAFVFSKYHGIREITVGSHDTSLERDIRDAGGALGPVDGENPELHNLTCSMTIIDPGDILYLTTDGISDNFDPVVTKIASAMRRHSDPAAGQENGQVVMTKPEMSPTERHRYSVKEMERIIHEFELDTEQPVGAQEMCAALLQHVFKITDPKRKVLENPDLYGKKMRAKERKRRDSQIVQQMSLAPGKLDHATIVAYEVGCFHGNEDENYEIEEFDEEETFDESDEAPPMNGNENDNGVPVIGSPSGDKRKLSFETSM